MRLILLALIATVATCATAVSGQLAGRCYDATLGPWAPIPGTHRVASEPPPPPDPETLAWSFPPRVLLTSEPPRRGGGEWLRVTVPPGALDVPMPFQSWRADEDSLWISMGNGFTGVSSALAPEGPNWAGVLRNMSDMGGTQRYSRSIRLSEVDCESPPPALASRDTPVPHSLPVVDGPSLVLGEPVPEGYRLRTGQFMDLVEDVQLAGYWAGAEMVLVRRNRDGLLSDIEVRYPDGHEPDIVREGLVADFGPGTPGDFRLAWQNYSTSASLQYNRTRVLLIAWRMRY